MLFRSQLSMQDHESSDIRLNPFAIDLRMRKEESVADPRNWIRGSETEHKIRLVKIWQNGKEKLSLRSKMR